MLRSIRKCLNEDVIEFYYENGDYNATERNPFIVAEHKANYKLAQERVGNNLWKMAQFLNTGLVDGIMYCPKCKQPMIKLVENLTTGRQVWKCRDCDIRREVDGRTEKSRQAKEIPL